MNTKKKLIENRVGILLSETFFSASLFFSRCDTEKENGIKIEEKCSAEVCALFSDVSLNNWIVFM